MTKNSALHVWIHGNNCMCRWEEECHTCSLEQIHESSCREYTEGDSSHSPQFLQGFLGTGCVSPFPSAVCLHSFWARIKELHAHLSPLRCIWQGQAQQLLCRCVTCLGQQQRKNHSSWLTFNCQDLEKLQYNSVSANRTVVGPAEWEWVQQRHWFPWKHSTPGV